MLSGSGTDRASSVPGAAPGSAGGSRAAVSRPAVDSTPEDTAADDALISRPADIPPGHPERPCPDLPLTPYERELEQQLTTERTTP
jgi:hypothetical protein